MSESFWLRGDSLFAGGLVMLGSPATVRTPLWITPGPSQHLRVKARRGSRQDLRQPADDRAGPGRPQPVGRQLREPDGDQGPHPEHAVLERLRTRGAHPVGIDYSAKTRTVWVACYRGTIERFADR
jgi:hypothetical protein